MSVTGFYQYQTKINLIGSEDNMITDTRRIKPEDVEKIGPGLPVQYEEDNKPDILPESPFTEMTSGHLCVKSEGFKYKGRIIVPKTSERPSTAGIVVDASPDSKFKRGDRILYSQFAGYLFNFKGVAGMRVMGESEVLGKLKPDIELEDRDEQ